MDKSSFKSSREESDSGKPSTDITKGSKIPSMPDFLQLDPNDIEIFVVRPVKKIAAILSHVVSNLVILKEYLIEIKVLGCMRFKVLKRFRDFDSLDGVVTLCL